ncbi:NUDIX domain-containing protein [Kitasatospora sp. HPMI-4]|uniref:NUDIX domain-containing protein n=1 Tax=Kitasatospora sp. HPMI-4 TaxID=3448443 RepID=UPI003F1D423A
MTKPEAPTHPNPLMVNPPPRRIGCLVIAFNDAGEVLMVDPDYKDSLILPGGSAEPGEAPNEAAARHFVLETGLVLDLWQIVAVDYVPAGEYPEGINIVFSCGVLTPRQIERIKHSEGTHLRGHKFVPMAELHKHTSPHTRQRISQAWHARYDGQGIPLLVMGEPVN